MKFTLSELSKRLEVPYMGNGDVPLTHACGLNNINDGGLAYLLNSSDMANLPTPRGIFRTKETSLADFASFSNSALVVPTALASEGKGLNLLLAEDPLTTHIQAIKLLHEAPQKSGTVDPSAVIGKNVSLGKNVTIDANAVLYDNVSIGDHTVIRAGVVLMYDVQVGERCLIYPNVTIRENCRIGNNVILQPSCVIGADGFGFYQRDDKNLKIPQVGSVIIEDDVEVGACTTIDRARFDNTIIRKGTKLDNLIQIAHNVQIGAQSLMAAQSGVAGSTIIGDHLMVGGQSGIKDNLIVGNRVTLLARSLISSNTPDQTQLVGTPSHSVKKWRKLQALINRLDKLYKRVTKLEAESKSQAKNEASG